MFQKMLQIGGGSSGITHIVGKYLFMLAGTFTAANIPINYSTDGTTYTNRVDSVSYSGGKITATSTGSGKFFVTVSTNGTTISNEVIEVSGATTIKTISTSGSSRYSMIVIDITDN